MAVLRERVGWSRPRARRGPDLSPEEAARVKAALRFLAKRHGTWAALAKAMNVKHVTVRHAVDKNGGVSAGVALRAARAAGVAVEDILSGAFPKPGVCPHCGRG
jgi:hypothetical protein